MHWAKEGGVLSIVNRFLVMYRGPKIGASIKLVSQKDGRDMDPQGTKFQPRGEGGPPGPGGRRPVGAQAGSTAGWFAAFSVTSCIDAPIMLSVDQSPPCSTKAAVSQKLQVSRL